MQLAVAAFNEQNQASAKAPFNNFMMVADPIEKINSAELAVGESLELKFERAFSGLVFNTKGYDFDTYGVLKSITVTMDKNNIAWSDATGKVDIAKKVDEKWALSGGTGVKVAKLTLNSTTGLKWSDDDYAFMQILPIDRSEAESYTIAFEFANGTVTLEKSSSKTWEANNFYTIGLDLDAQDYIVLNTTMIVNKSMPTLTGDGTIPNSGGKKASDITTFISGVSLSATQLADLKKYTGITALTLANPAADLGTNLKNVTEGTSIATLTLTKATTAPVITSLAGLTTLNGPEVTSVPAAAYKNNAVITKFKFPKVQTIGENAFEGATGVTTIGCNDETLIIGTTADEIKTSALTTIGSYALANLNLTLIDAPALTSLSAMPFAYKMDNAWTKVLLPMYDWSETMVRIQLLGSAALTDVDLSGISAIGGNTGISLDSKTSLKNVILKENTAIGAGAFKGAGTTGFNITNLNKITSVGDDAFSGCSKLTAAIDFENAIKAIGKNAFKGTAITSFDFTGITTIGEGAFQNVTTLATAVLDDVATLEKDVFNGATGLKNMNLKKVTTIKEGALTGLGDVTIMFNEVVTDIDKAAFHGTLGGQAGTKEDPIIVNGGTSLEYNLYMPMSQEGVENNTLTWKSGELYYKATFKAIYKLL